MTKKKTVARSKRARATKPTKPVKKARSKKDSVIALLRREGGATILDVMNATGWQAHSVRGFISGTLRKKLGLTVTASRDNGGVQYYRITTT